MKKAVELRILALLLLQSLRLIPEGKTAVMICDFTASDLDTIYSVGLAVNYATAFELPAGRTIKHVVLGDPVNWRAKVDEEGRVCFVKPLEPGKHASLTLVTADNLVLVFNLSEVSADGQRPTIAKVRIIVHDDDFFIAPARKENPVPESRDEAIRQFIRKKSRKYRLRRNHFQIENVCDDGVFTYLYAPRSQYRPAVFHRPGRKGELEPVPYVDKGDFYVIHKVLARAGDSFLLKLGNLATTISLQGAADE